MEYIFDMCVYFLLWLGNLLGMSYVDKNVWIFCIIGPIIFLFMFLLIIILVFKIKNLQLKIK